MNVRKLMSMTDYVNQILAYVQESSNHERGIKLIGWYSDLIHTPLTLDMFVSTNPLFPNFVFAESHEQALRQSSSQSVFVFSDSELGVTLYRKSEYAKSKSGMCYITSYHLKTVKDLCDKDIDFSLDSIYSETDLFD